MITADKGDTNLEMIGVEIPQQTLRDGKRTWCNFVYGRWYLNK